MDTQNSTQNQKFMRQLEDFFNTYLYKKIPIHLPPAVKEFIVKFGPWLILVGLILSVPGILMFLGLRGFGYEVFRFNGEFMLAEILYIIALVIEAMALPGLFSRSLKGWHMLYYAVLVSALGQLVFGDVVSMLVVLVLSLYVLFQVKEYYK
jgi:hypothetical protein